MHPIYHEKERLGPICFRKIVLLTDGHEILKCINDFSLKQRSSYRRQTGSEVMRRKWSWDIQEMV